MNINLKMHAEFNQYFDHDEISNQLDNLYLQDNLINLDLCEVDMESDDKIALQEFLDKFGQAYFGQVILDP